MTDKQAAATGSSHPRHQESTVMPVKERADAIGRANRALKALAEHPRATRKQLGSARSRLNDCYRLSDSGAVWEAAKAIEVIAAAVYGVPDGEPAPKAVRRWVTPPGGTRPAKPRRARHVPGNQH